jgi:hypothetical protein
MAISSLEWLYAWPLPSISLVYFLCWALPLPVSCTFAFSWFCITSACCLQFRYVIINIWNCAGAQSQSYVMTDGHSASLSWCKAPSVAQDQIFVIVRQLRVCWCGVPSLTSGRVCHLQLLLALASAVILRSPSHRFHNHIIPSQMGDSPNLEGQVSIFRSPRNRVAQLHS